jgi:hypothetical protein
MSTENFGSIPQPKAWSGESPSATELSFKLEEWRSMMELKEGDKISRKGIGWAEYTQEQWASIQKLEELKIELADRVKIRVLLSNDHILPRKRKSFEHPDSTQYTTEDRQYILSEVDILQGEMTIDDDGEQSVKEFYMELTADSDDDEGHYLEGGFAVFEISDKEKPLKLWTGSERDSRTAIQMNPTENDAKNALAHAALNDAYKKYVDRLV